MRQLHLINHCHLLTPLKHKHIKTQQTGSQYCQNHCNGEESNNGMVQKILGIS